MNFDENFPQHLKAIRKSNKLNQTKFGEILGIKRCSIGAYEEGRAQPSIETFLIICRVFKIDPFTFLNQTK